MKVSIVDNFFDDFSKVESYMKNTKLYKYKDHPESAVNTNEFWIGRRSLLLHRSNQDFFNLFWETFSKKFNNFSNQPLNLYSYLHLRLKQDGKEWIHKDDADYSLLVYLSKTNFKSGTILYDEDENEILNVKYIQNRAFLFSSNYKHKSAGNFGNNKNNGRYTYNAWFRFQSNR